MSKRRLVAALACRNEGTRLYGKPMQNLVPGITILDNIIRGINKTGVINATVLGLAESTANQCFVDVADKHDASYIWGGEKDVLMRLISCGRKGNATDVFRITSECPFPAWEYLDAVWSQHCADGNDITVLDMVPEGCSFEIYTQESLERSHAKGRDEERSEYCSAYARRCSDEFKIGIVTPEEQCQRLDIRLTVDYPEDLYLCRKVYEALEDSSPQIPLAAILAFLNQNPELHKIVEPYVDQTPLWMNVVK